MAIETLMTGLKRISFASSLPKALYHSNVVSHSPLLPAVESFRGRKEPVHIDLMGRKIRVSAGDLGIMQIKWQAKGIAFEKEKKSFGIECITLSVNKPSKESRLVFPTGLYAAISTFRNASTFSYKCITLMKREEKL